MKYWLIASLILLLTACVASTPHAVRQQTSPDRAPSPARILSSASGGITVESFGEGATRSDAEKSLIRRAIKEAAPRLVENIHDSDELTSAIATWVDEQQAVEYEDLLKRRIYTIDQEADDVYLLEGKVVLNNDYVKTKISRFVRSNKNKCATRLSLYITPDASMPLAAEDIHLGREFMHALQDQFIRAGFEIKKSNQQQEAQYQVSLARMTKVESGLNINFHFTVEVLDNRAAGALFASKQDSASASLALTGDPEHAKINALKQAASKVGAALSHQIIARKDNSEIVFYARGDSSFATEQTLAASLAKLYRVSTGEIISAQNSRQNGFASWSFEMPYSEQTCRYDFKAGLVAIQQDVLKAANPQVVVAKAGKKWSLYDGANPPPEFKRGPLDDFWSLEVERLIREGKLDSPYGAGFNAVDTLKARLRQYPGDPNALRLLQEVSSLLVDSAERALEQRQLAQAKRYAARAQSIWPKNPKLADLAARIKRTPPVSIAAPAAQPSDLLATADPAAGKKILQQGQYWAVLIANQNYRNGIPPLQTPHKDVDDLKQILIDGYGFNRANVIVVKDGGKSAILDQLYRTLQDVKANDSLLIYYAGHGHLDRGLGFWVPVDGLSPQAEGDSTTHLSSWISNSLVHDVVGASKAKHVLFISDSCFSGSFKPRHRGLARQQAVDSVPEHIYKLLALTSRTAITSGDLQPVLDGGGNGHSLFAQHLLDALRQRKTLSAGELFARIGPPVAASKIQTPQYFVMDKLNNEGGDFVFHAM